MVAEPAHGLSFALDAGKAALVETVGLDDSDGYVAVELRVVREIDALPAPLAEKASDRVPASGEG
jgi:hypothetical protein